MQKSPSPQPDAAASLKRLTALTAGALDAVQREQDDELTQMLDQRQKEIDRLAVSRITAAHHPLIHDLQNLESRLTQALSDYREQAVSELRRGKVGRQASTAYGKQ